MERSALSPRGRHCRQMDVASPGWTWCRGDRRGAAGMDVASSWRPCGRPETLRAVQNRGEVGRDVATSAETWRGRQSHGVLRRVVGLSIESWRRRESRGIVRRDMALLQWRWRHSHGCGAVVMDMASFSGMWRRHN